jgi:hypothetical protein
MSRWDISDLQNEKPYYICCSGSGHSKLTPVILIQNLRPGLPLAAPRSWSDYPTIFMTHFATAIRPMTHVTVGGATVGGSYEALFNVIVQTRWLVPESEPLEQSVDNRAPLPGHGKLILPQLNCDLRIAFFYHSRFCRVDMASDKSYACHVTLRSVKLPRRRPVGHRQPIWLTFK